MAAQKKSDTPFLSDIATIRKRARAHMERGAVTDSYTLDRDVVLKLLNEALATEIVCVLRYKAHYYLASGINAKSVAAEFLEHANEEQQHADQIAERITQLDGTPNFEPTGLAAGVPLTVVGAVDVLTVDVVPAAWVGAAVVDCVVAVGSSLSSRPHAASTNTLMIDATTSAA